MYHAFPLFQLHTTTLSSKDIVLYLTYSIIPLTSFIPFHYPPPWRISLSSTHLSRSCLSHSYLLFMWYHSYVIPINVLFYWARPVCNLPVGPTHLLRYRTPSPRVIPFRRTSRFKICSTAFSQSCNPLRWVFPIHVQFNGVFPRFHPFWCIVLTYASHFDITNLLHEFLHIDSLFYLSSFPVISRKLPVFTL